MGCGHQRVCLRSYRRLTVQDTSARKGLRVRSSGLIISCLINNANVGLLGCTTVV
jgi:hypothetical protein